ncbi:MAG TPA: hypothetical protein DCW68_01750 [Rhodospirillaceae bacterium]|nr:MAG: hypothetical protein A2018_04715 [Alphaproteobacteria bacterium GWF2_58_20]HAU28820.1 hypothetical protein [Rhodospirillaceae bacterium]
MRKLAAITLLLGMLTSSALAESPEDHARIVDEYQRKIRKLGRPVVVFDRFRAGKSTDYIRKQLEEIVGLDAESAEIVAPDIQRQATCHTLGQCARIPDASQDWFRIVLPNHPGGDERDMFNQFLKTWGAKLVSPFPVSELELNTFSLAHETLGHGTERDVVLDPERQGDDYRRAASELRADVFAAVDRAFVSGNADVARIVAKIRTVSCYNSVAQGMFGGNVMAEAEASLYNHGTELEKAADLIEKVLPHVRTLDEEQRLAFSEAVFAQVRPSYGAWQFKRRVLKLSVMMMTFGDDTQATAILREDEKLHRASQQLVAHFDRGRKLFLAPSP